ncbi:MAG: alanine racemase [Acidobacteria bacterium]|nr:alanine racemase [Acidobacteriota bacterium]
MPELYIRRPTWAEINLENLAFNFHSVKKFIGHEIEYMAVVKADGYGHGAVACAKKLVEAGADWLAVALLEEGIELRENDIKIPILCLGGFWRGQEKHFLEHNITPVIYQLETAEKFNNAAQEKRVSADVHIKIDTGMGRIGVRSDEVKEFAEKLRKFKNLRVEGIMTHFAAADNLSENNFTETQIKRFDEAVAVFEDNGFRPKLKDMANSPGAVVHKNSRGNLVRLGGILYGLGDDVLPKTAAKPVLKAVLSLHSRIAQIKRVPKGETIGYSRTFTTQRNSVIATVPIGYQDGYRRSLSNRGRAIINNQYVPVVGRISMDWAIFDATDLQVVNVNDEVILIGESGNLKVTAEELAGLIETISYEITCGISRRITRKYVGG